MAVRRARSGGGNGAEGTGYSPREIAAYASVEKALSAVGLRTDGGVGGASPEVIGSLPRESFNDADPALSEALVTVIRQARPEVVVETGVARGLSSALILAQLQANGSGRLFSIDLPTLRPDARTEVGGLVSEELRHRWTLRLGPSRRVLPRVLREAGLVDVFFHDSDHSYEAQSLEFRQAWPRIRPGGFLISDDVGNPAFEEIALASGSPAALIEAADKDTLIGILRKSS